MNPRQLPPGVLRCSGSEVALGSELNQDRVLILELVERGRLRSARCEHRRAGHLLVEVEPLDFARERQVLDRGPTGNHAKLRGVEVGVTGVGTRSLTRMADAEGSAVSALGRGAVSGAAVVPDGRVAAEQAGRPVRIPVVI